MTAATAVSRWADLRFQLLLAVAVLLATACGEGAGPGQEKPTGVTSATSERDAAEGAEVFRDASAETGLDFVHFNGMSGELYFCEMVGPGGALFDYDKDGDLDVFLVQGRMLGDKEIAEASTPPRHPLPLTDRLYRNDLEPGGGPRFVDVTAASGLEPAAGYGMGVAAGDFDNDGWTDLYVTALGPNRLLKNRGDGTFVDVTDAAGAGERRWSVSAVFFDADADGWLDLYVGNYVEYSVATDKRCRAATGAPDYCGPQSFRPEPDRLLRNLGLGADGRVTFEDVSARAGIDRGVARDRGGALGVVAADLNLDGRMDVYVANDGVANQMWINQGPSADSSVTFRNEALLGGSALNREGHPEAGMGVDAGDFDNDGDEDLFLAHLTQETNTLYRNNRSGQFEDMTVTSGLGAPSWDLTSFGTAFFDYDNDGWLDLLVLSGAVRHVEALVRAGDPYPLHQPNQLFRNLGDGLRFEETTARAGAVFELSEVSRGAAFGDLDNDGDADVLLANNNGPARLLLNQSDGHHHWLGLRLVGMGGRDMLGAWVEVVRPEGSLWRRVSAGGSYASARDPRLLVGLGASPGVSVVRVDWPGGRREQFAVAGVDRYLVLEEGTGDALP